MRYLEAKITKLFRRGGLNSTSSFTPGRANKTKSKKKNFACIWTGYSLPFSHKQMKVVPKSVRSY